MWKKLLLGQETKLIQNQVISWWLSSHYFSSNFFHPCTFLPHLLPLPHKNLFVFPWDKNMAIFFKITWNLHPPASPPNLCLCAQLQVKGCIYQDQAHLQVKGCIYQGQALQLEVGMLPGRKESAASLVLALTMDGSVHNTDAASPWELNRH